MVKIPENSTWWIVGGVVTLLLLGGGVAVATAKPKTDPIAPDPAPSPSNPSPKPPVTVTPPKSPGVGFPVIPGVPAGCGYKFALNFTNKPRAELITRVMAIIVQDRPEYSTQKFTNGKTIARYMAEQLVGESDGKNLPLDVVVALARRESSFNLHLDSLKTDIPADKAIGIMQIKPSTYKFTSGTSATELIGLPMANRLAKTIGVSCVYLRRCASVCMNAYGQAGDTLCDVLFRYTLGPTGAKDPQARKMRQGYVDDIIRWANSYTELRN